MNHCLLTNDVETTSVWNHCLSDKTGEKVLKEGMPVLLELYQKFIEALRNGCYQFQSFQDFIKKPLNKVVILRHDIDRRKYKALVFAELEYKLDIRATYYFRILPVSYNENLIKQIANMNHEIGYHYEDLSLRN